MSPQLWSRESTTTSATPYCSPFTIPQGVFIVNDTLEITLTQNAVFKPQCTGGSSGIVHGGFGDNSTVTDLRAPFYSSTSPQIFAIAVATVISYFLVILIFITPRTFFVGGPGGGAGFLTRRGLSGNSSVVGVGRRPLLQKIAAVTVAISMTIATADTFKVAKRQYEEGFMDSEEMVRLVVGGLEIRVVQVISDTFLWLAQVQTLIRLFPRHKEKVTIKWLGFALILLDVIFSSLNNFLVSGTSTRPLKSRDAIPALSYLFELAIGFIYASCIIYYSMSKYRFAFYHVKMRNICLVALLSVTSVLIPVVFFVIDVSSPDTATWGFYIRWVGAAAASVVVWEWVERIEALERDERKDGILGREIYDGDEMLDVTTANGVDWPGKRSRRDSDNSEDGGNPPGLKDRFAVKKRSLRSRIPFHNRKQRIDAAGTHPADTEAMSRTAEQDVSNPAPPLAVATPISRADTTSAGSTVYAVRYHNLHTTSPQIPEGTSYKGMVSKETSSESSPESKVGEKNNNEYAEPRQARTPAASRNKIVSRPLWTAVGNPFKRKRASPPAEVAGAQMLAGNSHRRSPAALVNSEKWNLRSRMDAFTTIQRDKLRARRDAGKVDAPLPVTIIPAQPRGTRTWSPEDFAGATLAATHLPAHSENTGSGHPVHQSSNKERIDISTVSAPHERQRIWSPEDTRHYEERSHQGGRDSSAAQRQHETPDGQSSLPDDQQLHSTQQQPMHPKPPPETVESRFDATAGSSHPHALTLAGADPIAQPQPGQSSHESNADGLHMQTAASLGTEVQDISWSQQQQIPPAHLSPPLQDAQPLPKDGPPTAPIRGIDQITESPTRPADASQHQKSSSSGVSG